MPTQREKMLQGELYDPQDPELAAARLRARELCRVLNAAPDADEGERRRLLRELLGSGGDSVWMQTPFWCDYGRNIHLGERVFFNFNCIVPGPVNATVVTAMPPGGRDCFGAWRRPESLMYVKYTARLGT